MLTALKWSGTSVTVGSLVAATTVRVIAGGAGVVCAAPAAGSAIAPSNSSPVALNCMIASQVQRMFEAPYALPAPLGMSGRFELLLDGNRKQRPSETEFVAVGVKAFPCRQYHGIVAPADGSIAAGTEFRRSQSQVCPLTIYPTLRP